MGKLVEPDDLAAITAASGVCHVVLEGSTMRASKCKQHIDVSAQAVRKRKRSITRDGPP